MAKKSRNVKKPRPSRWTANPSKVTRLTVMRGSDEPRVLPPTEQPDPLRSSTSMVGASRFAAVPQG